MPQISEFVHDPALSEETGHVGGMRLRNTQEINSLMDLMNQQASPFGGMPGDFVSQASFAGTPAADPSNWRLTRADAENPLQYMAYQGGLGSPVAPAGNWQPNDRGGYFTLDQLFGTNRGGSLPAVFQRGSNLPSTNNWQLTVPYGGGRGAIMRNGQVIWPGQLASLGHMITSSGQGKVGGAEQNVMAPAQAVSPGAGLSGANVWDTYYWPGGGGMGSTRWPATTDV